MTHSSRPMSRAVSTTLTVTLASVLLLTTAAPLRAAVTFYTDRTTFTAAAPGLSIDPFNTPFAFPPYPNLVFHTRPVTPTTNDSLFPAGCILPGLSITTQNPVFESQAIKCEAAGSGTMSVGTGTFQDYLILNFSPAVAAVGADVFGHVYPGPVFPGDCEVRVYNGSTQLGYTDPTLPSSGPGFVGVISPTANITKITLLFNPTADVDANTLVRNVTFHSVPPALPGDLNCDGAVNTLDVSALVQRLIDPAGYTAAHPTCNPANADINADGSVDALDIRAFLALILH